MIVVVQVYSSIFSFWSVERMQTITAAMKSEVVEKKARGPVVIGGVGGSGTRVFAEILRGLGFYIGDCLNPPLDNLWFTLLCKRPQWYAQNVPGNEKEIHRALRILEKAMTRGLSPNATAEEIEYVCAAARDITSYPVDMGAGSEQADEILRSAPPDLSRYSGWGWKEPNNHIFLEHLAACFPDLHYIHVLRHGLDMAYSTNHQQLLNWGELYDVTVADRSNVLPQELLRYWIAANEHAVTIGKELLGERFLAVRFEDLCANPQSSIQAMADFLGAKPEAEALSWLASLPTLPKSSGRYRKNKLTLFLPSDIEGVEQFGYVVETEMIRQ